MECSRLVIRNARLPKRQENRESRDRCLKTGLRFPALIEKVAGSMAVQLGFRLVKSRGYAPSNDFGERKARLSGISSQALSAAHAASKDPTTSSVFEIKEP